MQKRLRIPEQFIWHIFHGLVVALIDLQKGRPPPNAFVDRKWRKEIVHLDIKPANILLNARFDEDRFPRPCIADWGCAWECEPFGQSLHRIRIGTVGFRPPVSFATDFQRLSVWQLEIY